MSVELYEGAWGVTRGGKVTPGALLYLPREPGDHWAWGVDCARWALDGEDGNSFVNGPTSEDIIAVFPTREAAEAHLRGEKPEPELPEELTLFSDGQGNLSSWLPKGDKHYAASKWRIVSERGTAPPAEPQPVTWPDGVRAMDFGGTETCVSGGHVESSEADGSYSADTARQLAALIAAAADCIERSAE